LFNAYSLNILISKKTYSDKLCHLKAPIAYQSLDLNGVIIDVNDIWCEKTGYSKDSIIGSSFEELLVPEDKEIFKNAFEHLLKTGKTDNYILNIKKKNKEIITVEYYGCKIEDENGLFLQTNCFLYDISKFIQAKKDFERNQELEKLRAEIWKTAALLSDEKTLIQILLDKCGPVLGSENISYMPYNESDKNIVVEQIWRKDGSKVGIGDTVPVWIFKHFNKKPYVFFSFDNLPAIIKPVLTPFQKKYDTKSTLVIPYGDSETPRGYLTSQTYSYNKIYTESEIRLFIELSNIIYLKSIQLQNNKELIESRKRFKILTEQATEGIVIHKNGIIQDINPAVEKMFNIIRGDIISKNIFEFIHPKHAEVAKRRMMNNEKDTVEFELRKKDGTNFYAEVTARDSASEEDNIRVISINNITEKKITEKNLLKLSSIVEQSPISIVITDLDGNIEYVNKKFSETVGYQTEFVIGKNPNILSTGKTSNKEYKKLWDTVLSGKVWTGEFLNKRKDNSLYWEHATIAPIFDKSGNIINLTGLKVDITEKKLAEEKLQKSQEKLKASLHAKDKLFSVISHDLRSPFNAILGFSDMVREKAEGQDYEGLTELSLYLNKAAHQTYQLLNNLLNWSGLQTGKIKFTPEKFILSESIQDVIKLLKRDADSKNITVNFSDIENTWVIADRNMIETILRNLISNAVKFTPKDGFVTISLNSKSDEFCISIHDTGVGINKENIEKLFKPESTFSTKGTDDESGTGLGLLLCKEFTDFHKGSVSVVSEINKGTEITVKIPQNSDKSER
jgi:PAS domain S-box-containing protein